MENIAQNTGPDKPSLPYVVAMQKALPFVDKLIAEGVKLEPFDLMRAALDMAENENGENGLWSVAYSDRAKQVDAFHDWVIKSHFDLKKKLLNLEQCAKEGAMFADKGSWCERLFRAEAARYFLLRERFDVFDDYYSCAVNQEYTESLNASSPVVKLLWAWFELEAAQA